MAETNPLVDHPSFLGLGRFASIEVEEMSRYGEACLQKLVTAEDKHRLKAWELLLEKLLVHSGTLDGSCERQQSLPGATSLPVPDPFNPVPKRDERFQDPYNMGVHAEVFLYDPQQPVAAKPLMLYYKRLREIDVPEVIASIIAQTKDKPWEYYADMTRQLWDEARHAMMGEVGFVQAGLDWREFVRINFTWSLALNTQLEPLERHAVLYLIEQGLMPKTGKRFEWEVALASGIFRGTRSRLRLGRRGSARAHRPRLVRQRDGRFKTRDSLRGRTLVARSH
jgi:hypothetical protein